MSVALADIARAGQEDVVLLPTVTAARETPGSPMILRLPESTDGRDVLRWARRLDMTLREAVQDLGLTLDVSERPNARAPDLAEDAIVERAQKSWVISPRLEPFEGKIRLRIVAVAPGSKVLLVRTQEVEPREVELRAMVMMRDLVLAGRGSGTTDVERPGRLAGEPRVTEAARSAGRAVLALNSAALGGYVGFSIQRSSGSTDPRLDLPADRARYRHRTRWVDDHRRRVGRGSGRCVVPFRRRLVARGSGLFARRWLRRTAQ